MMRVFLGVSLLGDICMHERREGSSMPRPGINTCALVREMRENIASRGNPVSTHARSTHLAA